MLSSDLVKNRILVTGSNGMLGQRTVEFYRGKKTYELLCLSVEEKSVIEGVDYLSCDLSDKDKIKKAVYDFCPDSIINAAAYTNVDLSETERELAWKINVKGVEYLAEAARVIDAHLVHISTDYIFDGKNGPYNETAKPNPIGYYGRTKLASENALKISGINYTVLRTNVLYGIAKNSRPDFVKWVVNMLREGKQIKIVTDQINNPTFIDDLVQAINQAIEFRKFGVFNIGGAEFLSRYDFTLRIAEYFNLNESLIVPIKTSDLNQAARRPLKSGLLTIKAQSVLGFKPHSIHETLYLMQKELGF
ncbi:MAG TPA: dTDP-4-dehydrorhamnose reductase [Ignavibacteriaceae bacterium]|nr:dTDP-4-dehydrorhamnose reductase [Ignavibacteriaceae bacterium]